MARPTKPHRISVRLSPSLNLRLRHRTKLTGKSESVIVREAIEAHLAEASHPASAYDLARSLGLVGTAKGLPPDLSTNPKYLRGFGGK
jgi:predicted DNA-binding protein